MSLASDITALRRVSLLEGFSDEALRLVAFSAAARPIAATEVLFVEGDPATGAFVVASGRVRLKPMHGREIRAGAGALLTLGTLLADIPYPGTATVEEAGEVLAIGRDAFRRVLTEYPDLARLLHARLAAAMAGLAREGSAIRAKLEAAGDLITRPGPA